MTKYLEAVAKLHASEKTRFLRSVARATFRRPCPADGGLPKRAAEEEGTQLASKGCFCVAKSFATASLVALFLPVMAFALFQGNPAQPLIIEKGFFISPESFLSVKMGYQGDWVWNRKMKSISNAKGVIDRFKIQMNQGVFTIDVLDRLESYISFGSFTTELWHRPQPYRQLCQYESHDRWTLGGGLRLVLMQWGNTTLGADGTMQYAAPRMKWSAIDGVPSAKSSRMNYVEWQTSLAVAHAVEIFTPYLGVTYSVVHAHLDQISSFVLPATHFKMGNRDRFGLALGCTLSPSKKVDLTFEARLFSEQAATAAGNIKF